MEAEVKIESDSQGYLPLVKKPGLVPGFFLSERDEVAGAGSLKRIVWPSSAQRVASLFRRSPRSGQSLSELKEFSSGIKMC
jgi:hypothetical protein